MGSLSGRKACTCEAAAKPSLSNQCFTFSPFHFFTSGYPKHVVQYLDSGYLKSKQPIPEIQPVVQLFTNQGRQKLVINAVAIEGDGGKMHGQEGFAVGGKHSELVNYHLLSVFRQKMPDEPACQS